MSRKGLVALVSFVLLALAAFVVVVVRRSFVFEPSAARAPQSPNAVQSSEAVRPAPSWPTPFSVELKALPAREALPEGTLRILVVGDSVAKFLGLAMRYRQDEAQTFVAERGVGSCSIFESKPYIEDGKRLMSSSCSMNWVSDVAELRPDVTLIVMGGGFLSEGACTETFREAYQKRLFELTRAMAAHAGRVVITRVPYPIKAWRHSNVLARVDCFNRLLVDAAEKGNHAVLDLMSYVCPTQACQLESRGKPIRPDGLHFDGGGAEDTARWVLRELQRIHREAPRH